MDDDENTDAPKKIPTQDSQNDPFQGLLRTDSFTATALQEVLDRAFVTFISPMTGGLSPAALLQARHDWLLHLAGAPGKQLSLQIKAWRKWLRLNRFALEASTLQGTAAPCIEPLAQDKRFSDPAWQRWPFNVTYQGFLLQQQWWHNAVTGVPGVSGQHERVLAFGARQILDMFSPSNFVWSNPVLLERTVQEGGQNLWRGMQHLLEDLHNRQANQPESNQIDFRVGKDVACTPGKVIYRNRLIELIQYEPATDKVRPEPVLMVPAWINKYYILDLSPHNSMVRFLTEQGFTVFMVSWLNPGPADRDLTMEDYRKLGVLDAIDAVQGISECDAIHGVGYCLGGTLLAIAAASLMRDGTGPFASLSFFASQFDFTEPGELQLFINESQLNFLESMMWEQGFLDARQMSGAFQLLNSNDLIWSRNMHAYLLGERPPAFDLMAWNADTTRMPFRMHSQYLRQLYLNNDLAEGGYQVNGEPIALTDIRVPVFSVGTLKDHVAPWQSVYKAHLLLDTDLTFVLTTGGHNAGIVSEPGHAGRSYQIYTRTENAKYIAPETWAERTGSTDGSWWIAWADWLGRRSAQPQLPPPMGNGQKGYPVLGDAPGTYVMTQ